MWFSFEKQVLIELSKVIGIQKDLSNYSHNKISIAVQSVSCQRPWCKPYYFYLIMLMSIHISHFIYILCML